MKLSLAVAAVVATLSLQAFADSTQVQGHVRKDGTYVAPHYRTTPDDSRGNNWSSQGNTNPYTGREGTVNPYPQAPVYPTSPNPYAPPHR